MKTRHDTSCLCAYETLLHPRCRCVLPRVKKARCSSRFPQCLVFTSALTAALLLGVSSSHPLEPSREPWAGLQQCCTRWNIPVHRDERSAAAEHRRPSPALECLCSRRRAWTLPRSSSEVSASIDFHTRRSFSCVAALKSALFQAQRHRAPERAALRV